MYKQPVWTESIPGMRTRGLPYFNRGVLKNVVANMGTWNGIPDLDSIQSLNEGCKQDYIAPNTSHLIPKWQYFPLCGMNFAFRRKITVLTYFPLMGDNSPFRRFRGYLVWHYFQKNMRSFGFCNCLRDASLHHNRASNVMNNLVKEAPGIKFNEHFWEIIDKCPLKSTTPKECMLEMGDWLINPQSGFATSMKIDTGNYVPTLGNAIKIWANLYKES